MTTIYLPEGNLTNLLNLSKDKNNINKEIFLKKNINKEIIEDLKVGDNQRYSQDWFFLEYNIKNPQTIILDNFFCVLLEKNNLENGLNINRPWSNDALLQLFSQVIFRKNNLKEIIGKDPTIIYENKPIDFNNLLDLDMGYLTNEIYRNEREVLDLANLKGIKYKEGCHLPKIKLPQECNSYSVQLH